VPCIAFHHFTYILPCSSFLVCHVPSILPDPPILSVKPTLIAGGTLSVSSRLTVVTRLDGNQVFTGFQTVATPVTVPTRLSGALTAGTTLKAQSVTGNLPTRLHPRQVFLPSPTNVADPVRICNRQESVELDANYTRVVGASVFWGLISANKGSTTDTTVFNQVSAFQSYNFVHCLPRFDHILTHSLVDRKVQYRGLT
jgi:hypothetical protein